MQAGSFSLTRIPLSFIDEQRDVMHGPASGRHSWFLGRCTSCSDILRVKPRYSCRGAQGVILLNIFSHYVICVQVADAAAAALKKADEQVERRTAVAEQQLAGGRAALQKQKETAAAALAEHKQTAAAVDAEVRTRLAAAVAGKLGEWGTLK